MEEKAMINEIKFDIYKENIPCPSCGKQNLYANAICEGCGARLDEEKEKIKNILDMTEFTFTGQYKKGDKLQQWCDKLEEYFKEGKDQPQMESYLIEKPLKKLLNEKGHIALYNILEGNIQLKECIFKKTRHVVCSDFIASLAQNGFTKEAASYMEIMAENKLETKNFKKLVVELGILTSQKKINAKFAPFLMRIAATIGKDYGAVLALVLLDYDTTYSGNIKKKVERLMFSYEKALPLLENGKYQKCDLKAFEKLLSELANLDEDVLANSLEEMFDIAADNQDEPLGQMLVESFEEYLKKQGIDKADKFLRENDYLKSNIFETFETVASSFIIEIYKKYPSETFAEYFAMVLNNEKFMNCEKKTKSFFGKLSKAESFDFISQLALKKAFSQLPVDLNEWLDFEKPKSVKESEEVKEVKAPKKSRKTNKPRILKKQQETVEKEPEKSKEPKKQPEEILSDEDFMIEAMVCKYLDFDTNIPYDTCLGDDQDEDDIFGEVFYGMDASKKEELGIDGLMEEWLAYKGVDPYNHKEAVEYLKYCGDEEIEDEFAYIYYDLTEIDKKKKGIEGQLYDWLVAKGVDPYDEEQVMMCIEEAGDSDIQKVKSVAESSEYEQEYEFDSDTEYEYGFNFDFDVNTDYGADQYTMDYDEDDETDEDDEENEFEFDTNLDLDFDFDKDDLLEAIEDAEDYAYLASVGGSSAYDYDEEVLREEEFIDGMMLAKGENPYDYNERMEFLFNPFGGGDDDEW